MSHHLRQRNISTSSLPQALLRPTYSPISQFPYALKALPSVLEKQWDSPDFAPYRDAFPEEHRKSPAALEAHVKDLTERDVKVAYLKDLQGYLWEDGYKSGAYSTPLYPDVVEFFERWPSESQAKAHPDANDAHSGNSDTNENGATAIDATTNGTTSISSTSTPSRQIAIYSSGSIFAQKLLFQHVQTPSQSSAADKSPSSPSKSPETRDLNPLITAYYDTTNAGLKASPESYTKIFDSLSSSSIPSSEPPLTPSQILFLSDVPAEIDAALAAGMQAVVVEREGNKDLTEEERGRLWVVGELGEMGL